MFILAILDMNFGSWKDAANIDSTVYERDKDFSWVDQSNYEKVIQYFAGNAAMNVHLTKQNQRCFKKGLECYANLPDGVSESATLNQTYEATGKVLKKKGTCSASSPNVPLKMLS
jgi:hypothetical protein